MKKINKILTFIVVFTLCVICGFKKTDVNAASAALTGPGTVRAGDTITLNLNISSPGSYGFEGSLAYDGSVSLVSMSAGTGGWKLEQNGSRVVVYDDALSNPLGNNSTVIKAVFKVNNVATGTGINISFNDIVVSDGNNESSIGTAKYSVAVAALAGCIGFMMIKYEWGIGKAHWFKAYPFAIVAINILIAVASDFESAINGWYSWWLSSEDVWLYGGWHNVFNGIAGIINILCMTGWWAVYTSKDKKDMIWPDMIWVYILVYDVWNFAYTYNCLPTHSWFCGVALLLAPTIAALLWNKGGWIMNRANTLCIWCMFAQVFPLFQETFSDGKQVFPWATIPKLYADGTLNGITAGGSTNADPTMMTIVSLLALIVNIVAFIYIIRTARKKKKNPYKEEIFTDFKYYKDAAARAEIK